MRREASLTVSLAGRASGVTFSPTGRFVAVAGYDGRVQLIDAERGRIFFRHVVRGPKRDLPIHHHAFREDERFYAFSCLRRVFVVDLQRVAVVSEIPVHESERLLSVPFALDPRTGGVFLGHAPHVVRRAFDGSAEEALFLTPDPGLAEDVSVDASGRFIACKRGTGRDGASVLLHDRASGTTRALRVPYDYVPGRAMSEVKLRFSRDARSLLVLSKTGGFLRFDVETGEQSDHVSWDVLGFRTVHGFRSARISETGRYLLVNTERSTSPDLASWSVPVPDGLRWVLHDLESKKNIAEASLGEGGADVNEGSQRLAWLRLRATHGLAKDELVLERFP